MKIAIISLGGKSSKLLAEKCRKYFEEVEELDIRKFEIHITNEGENITYLGKSLKKYDCVYLRGSYKYGFLQRAITSQIKKDTYTPISPKAFTIGHDKFLTLLELQKENVSVPKTYYVTGKKAAKNLLKNKIKYPVIIKVQEGTHGKGVMIAESEKSAMAILDWLQTFKKPFILQEFMETEETTDVRVVVCNGKVTAAYKRKAKEGEFRANIHAGGIREKYELSKEEEKLAIKSAKVINADICGIDIINSKKPAVIEANLSPSIYKLNEIAGKDALDGIARMLYKKSLDFQEKKENKIKKRIQKKIEKKNGKAKKSKE